MKKKPAAAKSKSVEEKDLVFVDPKEEVRPEPPKPDRALQDAIFAARSCLLELRDNVFTANHPALPTINTAIAKLEPFCTPNL